MSQSDSGNGTGAGGNGETTASALGSATELGQSQGPGSQPPQVAPDMSAILGQAAWVLMHSPLHKHMFISDLEWLLVPPVGLKQFRLWRRDNLPVAFASWAFLSEEVEQRLSSGVRRLAPGDWRSGDRLWLIDLVCPFGGMEEAAMQLKSETFKDRTVKTLGPAPDGQGMAVVEW